jgi:LruC domain-containing protein
MNISHRTLPLLALASFLGGCMPRIDPAEPADQISIENLKVADGFTFRTTRDVLLNVQVSNPAFAGERYRINVYDDFPTVGQRITSGMTDANQRVRLELRTAAPLTHVYVERIDPFGASDVRRVAVADYTSVDFKQATPTLSLRTAAQSNLDCSAGTTKVYNNHSGNLTLKKGDIIGITGTFRGEINMNGGGEARICGTAQITGMNLNGSDSKVYFLEGSTVTINNLNLNNKDARAYNYSSSLSFTSGTSWGGYVENHGKISINGDLNLNGNSRFVNNGEVTISTDLNNNSSLTNNNSIVVKGSYRANGGAYTLNVCKLLIEKELTVNKDILNQAYIKATQRTTINGGSTIFLSNGAQLSTGDMTMNGGIAGPGSGASAVKVSGNTTFNGGASLKGQVSYCDANGVETNWGRVPDSFFQCEGAYLPTSACNPEGFGKPAIKDSDGDGVSDVQDEFPNDPSRAFVGSTYPSASGYATYGFEDLWPAKGDYDFNDLVVDFRITKDLNGSNRVVAMHYKLNVRGMGASYDNGFGFQLDDVSSDEVESVKGASLTKGLIKLNGNGTEAGQPKAVVIAFDTPEPLIDRKGGSGFNVIPGNPRGSSHEIEIIVKFRSPIDDSKVTLAKINPFLFINSKREQEVHLINFAPTAKASGSYFSTLHDTSDPARGRYYRTSNNLPWALEIPVQFEYPVENAPITEAYVHFADWARSGGTKNADWFINKPGNARPEKIFK